jgi:hypothetical protein
MAKIAADRATANKEVLARAGQEVLEGVRRILGFNVGGGNRAATATRPEGHRVRLARNSLGLLTCEQEADRTKKTQMRSEIQSEDRREKEGTRHVIACFDSVEGFALGGNDFLREVVANIVIMP